jgi:hypothetical protein
VIFLRLPGRSGWVITSTISWPAACNARSEGTAKAAVPAKTILRKVVALARRRRYGFFLVFGLEVLNPPKRIEAG